MKLPLKGIDKMTPELINALNDLCNEFGISDCVDAEYSSGCIYVTKSTGEVICISGMVCED